MRAKWTRSGGKTGPQAIENVIFGGGRRRFCGELGVIGNGHARTRRRVQAPQAFRVTSAKHEGPREENSRSLPPVCAHCFFSAERLLGTRQETGRRPKTCARSLLKRVQGGNVACLCRGVELGLVLEQVICSNV